MTDTQDRGNATLELTDPHTRLGEGGPAPVSGVPRTPALAATHPAGYSQAILHEIRKALAFEPIDERGYLAILDPFGGTGKIHDLAAMFRGTVQALAVEIEEQWAYQSIAKGATVHGDAIDWATRWADTQEFRFDAIVTSPVYPNGIADNYVGEGKTRRNTYASHLGQLPANGSSSGLGRWSTRRGRDAHMQFNERAWAALVPVLKPGGLLLLNTKDPTWTVDGVQHVGGFTAWLWRHLAETHGLILQGFDVIPTRGLPQGSNHTQRTGFEYLLHLRKPLPPKAS